MEPMANVTENSEAERMNHRQYYLRSLTSQRLNSPAGHRRPHLERVSAALTRNCALHLSTLLMFRLPEGARNGVHQQIRLGIARGRYPK